MYPDAKKLLTEPLLWVGAIALCVPVLASGQLGNLRDFLSFEHGAPHVQNVAIAEIPGSASKAKVTPTVEVAPIRVGSQARAVALGGDVASVKNPAASIELPAMKGSSTNGSSSSPAFQSNRANTQTRDLDPPTRSTPDLALAETEPKVAISPLPPVDGADPGSLLDAAKMLGYENTQEPELSEPRYGAPEISNSQIANSHDAEGLGLSLNEETEGAIGAISLDPVSNDRRAEFSHLSTESSVVKPSAIESPTIEIESPQIASPSIESSQEDEVGLSPVHSGYRQSSALPPTPMKFQAALRQRAAPKSGQQQPHFFGTSLPSNGFQTMPMFQQPNHFQQPTVSTHAMRGTGQTPLPLPTQ